MSKDHDIRLIHPLRQQRSKSCRLRCRSVEPTVIRKRPPILKLLAGKDQTLLVRRDPLLVLDLGLDVVDRVRRLDLEGDGLAR